MTRLELALGLAAAGMKIFPCHSVTDGACSCGDEGCKPNNRGKHPRLGGWQREATSDEGKIRAWFGFWPDMNYGVATGAPSGVWVLDIDPDKGGWDSIAELVAQQGAPPTTFETVTGSGGQHLWFKHVAGLRNRSAIMPGIDARGDGGYVIGPGCANAKGQYAVGSDADVAEAPAWLVEMVLPGKREPRATKGEDRRPTAEELPLVREHARADIQRRPPGKEGQGGGPALLHVCRDLYRGYGLPDDAETRAIVDEYCARCEPPWSDAGEVDHKVDEGQDEDKDPDGRPVGYLLHEFYVRQAFELAANEETARCLTDKVVRLDVDEHRVVDEVIGHLGLLEGLYTHSGALADVVMQRGDDPKEGGDDGIRRSAGACRVRRLPAARVRTLITRACKLEKWDGRAKDFVPAHPTDWLVSGVHAEGCWRGISPLIGVGDAPVILPDGRVVSAPGYDRESGIFVSDGVEVNVPDAPTRDDARAAADRVLALVDQFDFSKPASRAAWLCALLTVVGRFAFRGSVPLMLFDASTPSSGKTLLVDLISSIAFRRSASRTAWSPHDEEVRKTITATAMAGDRLLLFDNVPNGSTLQSAALDAALTSDGWWSARILGTNDMFDGLLHTVFFATGNNLSIGGDLARRILHVRLEPQDDRPELRTGFRYPGGELLIHAKRSRAAILSDLFTILRAAILAGRPRVGLSAWGSFDDWSATVRAPLVWLGLPDPGDTREALRDMADRGRSASWTLVHELDRMLTANKRGRRMTAKAVLMAVADPSWDALKDAIDELTNVKPGHQPTPSQLARVFSTLRGRYFGGKTIEAIGEKGELGREWTVKIKPT